MFFTKHDSSDRAGIFEFLSVGNHLSVGVVRSTKKIKAQHLGGHVLSGKRALPFVRITGAGSNIQIHSFGIDHCLQNCDRPVK
jgi:hypothetical protein